MTTFTSTTKRRETVAVIETTEYTFSDGSRWSLITEEYPAPDQMRRYTRVIRHGDGVDYISRMSGLDKKLKGVAG